MWLPFGSHFVARWLNQGIRLKLLSLNPTVSEKPGKLACEILGDEFQNLGRGRSIMLDGIFRF